MQIVDLYRRLRSNGVLGLNWRNAEFQLVHNRRKFFPLVDDKLKSKRLAQDAGIEVPELFGVIEYPHEVRTFEHIVRDRDDFVVKPAEGSGGDGILVVMGRDGGAFRLANGTVMTSDEMRFHINNILAGTFSLGGQPDKALIEYRIRFDPIFDRIAFQGVPDIRIIVFYGVPVMAMTRLPTEESSGKANLHQGAIGAGIDMTTGKTLNAVWHDRIITQHPDTGAAVSGVQIPHWDRLLHHAARSFELTHLGYQGIDMVLDSERGPVMLELNARPGLSIQIANGEGLGLRLAKIEACLRDAPQSLESAEQRVRFTLKNFPPRPVARTDA
ncbi:MAG: alpha-L-glutamate ligase-like protein [Rhodospirillales bacterium]